MYDDAQINSDASLFPKIMDAYMSMMLVALRSGITRVATLQLANASGNQLNFGAFLGERGIPARGTGYKRPSQLARPRPQPDDERQTQDHRRQVVHEKFADFIAKRRRRGAGGNMLKKACSLGQPHESGDNHHSQRIPWVLAGQAGGGVLRPGRSGRGKTISSARATWQGHGRRAQPHWSGTAGAAI